MPNSLPTFRALIQRASRLLIASLSLLFSQFLLAQSAQELSHVKKIYVAPVSGGTGAAELRVSLVRQLRKRGQFQLVETPAQADAVLKSSGYLWITGYISMNPRAAPTSNRQAVYNGYLSVELLGKDNAVIWSYLVTPTKFSGESVPDDLAGSLTRQLIAAQTKGSPRLSDETSERLEPTVLRGAGATFPAPLYLKWLESFSEKYPSIHVQYDAVGSSEGVRLLAEGKVDFAGSDVPDAGSTASFSKFATVMGGVVCIYNLKNVSSNLKFTPEMLAGIYLGKIRKWNDPLIVAFNKGIALPDAEISVVHRSDGSGTTYTWSDFLSKTDANWKSTIGTGTTLAWPVGTGAEHNEGVAAMVEKTPNSIGYVELAYAIHHQLSFGLVRNAAGEFIHASLEAVALAAKNAALSSPQLPSSIINAVSKGAYPIATFTWLLVPRESVDTTRRPALVEMLRWILTNGQKECSALGYAPLPRDLAERELYLLNHTR